MPCHGTSQECLTPGATNSGGGWEMASTAMVADADVPAHHHKQVPMLAICSLESHVNFQPAWWSKGRKGVPWSWDYNSCIFCLQNSLPRWVPAAFLASLFFLIVFWICFLSLLLFGFPDFAGSLSSMMLRSSVGSFLRAPLGLLLLFCLASRLSELSWALWLLGFQFFSCHYWLRFFHPVMYIQAVLSDSTIPPFFWMD